MHFTLAILAVLASSCIATPLAKLIAETSIPTNPPKAPVEGLWSNSEIYAGLVLEHHNVHRRNHSAPDLHWNNTLAGLAEEAAWSCKWGHNLKPGGGGYGQNIAAGYAAPMIGQIISNGFYNSEFNAYPYPWGKSTPDMSHFEQWGHLSQVLWKNTKTVGCYTHTCTPTFKDTLSCNDDGTSYLEGTPCGNDGMHAIFTVCNYFPAGNVRGAYENVGGPKGHGTVTVTDKGTTGL